MNSLSLLVWHATRYQLYMARQSYELKSPTQMGIPTMQMLLPFSKILGSFVWAPV